MATEFNREELMRKHSKLIVVAFTAVMVLTFFSLSFLERKVWSSTPSQQARPFKVVQNKTRSFEVVQTRQLDGGEGAELSLRNGYDKNVTAYVVSANGLISLVDFLYSDAEDERKIAPGGVYSRNLSFVESPDTPDLATQQNLGIKILAVMFDDKTGDGDPELIARILDMRMGSKIQSARILQILKETLNSSRTTDDTLFDTLRARMSALPTDSERAISPSSRARLKTERDDVLWWLERLKNSPTHLTSQERIARLREHYESLVARL
jgi:hypothetical protein